MHPARKFSQNSCKKKLLNNQLNKENAHASITESFARKFSVGQHGLSDEADFLPHKKSIAEEKISVFLENSQNRTFAFDKASSQSQIRHLNKLLKSQNESVLEILGKEVDKNELKSEELRNFLITLVDRLSEETKDQSSSSQTSFCLSDQLIRPYLDRELAELDKHLSKLKTKQGELTQIKSLSPVEKSFLMKALLQVEKDQMQQLAKLDKLLPQVKA